MLLTHSDTETAKDLSRFLACYANAVNMEDQAVYTQQTLITVSGIKPSSAGGSNDTITVRYRIAVHLQTHEGIVVSFSPPNHHIDTHMKKIYKDITLKQISHRYY